MNPCSISCELHDYIEIACMYGYQIKIHLKEGQIIEGKASDLFTSPQKLEYLIVENKQKQQVELNQIEKIQVLTPNAKFKNITF